MFFLVNDSNIAEIFEISLSEVVSFIEIHTVSLSG